MFTACLLPPCAASNQQFAFGCRETGRQKDEEVNGAKLKYSRLLTAERSTSSPTHTCHSRPTLPRCTSKEHYLNPKLKLPIFNLADTCVFQNLKGHKWIHTQGHCWPTRHNIISPSPRLSRSVWRAKTQREPDVYGFSFNSNKAVGGPVQLVWGFGATDSGNWNWKQVQHNNSVDNNNHNPYNRHSSTACTQSCYLHKITQLPQTIPFLHPGWLSELSWGLWSVVSSRHTQKDRAKGTVCFWAPLSPVIRHFCKCVLIETVCGHSKKNLWNK